LNVNSDTETTCGVNFVVCPALSDQFLHTIELNNTAVTLEWVASNLAPYFHKYEVPHHAFLENPSFKHYDLCTFILGVSIIDLCIRSVYKLQVDPGVGSESFVGYNWMTGTPDKPGNPTEDFIKTMTDDSRVHIKTTIVKLAKVEIFITVGEIREKCKSHLQVTRGDDLADLTESTIILANYFAFFGSDLGLEALENLNYLPCKILARCISDKRQGETLTLALKKPFSPGIWNQNGNIYKSLVSKVFAAKKILDTGININKMLKEFLKNPTTPEQPKTPKSKGAGGKKPRKS